MIISFKSQAPDINPVTIHDTPLEQVKFFKLLGVWIADDLTWHHHINKVCSMVGPCLYYLRQLKRSGLSDKDLIAFYGTVIRAVTVVKYACIVWHAGLTAGDAHLLEQTQKKAMQIIYPELQ